MSHDIPLFPNHMGQINASLTQESCVVRLGQEIMQARRTLLAVHDLPQLPSKLLDQIDGQRLIEMQSIYQGTELLLSSARILGRLPDHSFKGNVGICAGNSWLRQLRLVRAVSCLKAFEFSR